MGSFVEEQEEEENSVMNDTTNDDTIATSSEIEEVKEAKQESHSEQTANADDDYISEKYKGKSVGDITKMHQEAEKLIGRQGAEVGELRRIVDDFIKAQTYKHNPEEATVEDIDYFTDPQKAVQSQIDAHPAIRQAQIAATHLKQSEVQNRIKSSHPDYLDIASDPSFAEWVQGSKVRLELFGRADQQFDFEAANELLSTWKERKEIGKKMVEVSAVDRKQQLKAATTSIGSGSDESVGKKIYRRADIIKLMQTDPDRYDSMQDEIMSAYRENRVK